PLAELKNNLSELPRDREIVVVCRSGNRSREAVSILEEAGFSDVFSLKGGMIAWENAGYPLEKSSP
ncbi:MAG: rhodanese-like domain-containing protein, partial [Chloroflexi bacterium]|nr:rhodanese-like domain-containing protein [Chloroflexota bacterium]